MFLFFFFPSTGLLGNFPLESLLTDYHSNYCCSAEEKWEGPFPRFANSWLTSRHSQGTTLRLHEDDMMQHSSVRKLKEVTFHCLLFMLKFIDCHVMSFSFPCNDHHFEE